MAKIYKTFQITKQWFLVGKTLEIIRYLKADTSFYLLNNNSPHVYKSSAVMWTDLNCIYTVRFKLILIFAINITKLKQPMPSQRIGCFLLKDQIKVICWYFQTQKDQLFLPWKMAFVLKTKQNKSINPFLSYCHVGSELNLLKFNI